MQHVLIIGKVWPEPISSAAGSRMLQLIRVFSDHGWKVSFACPARESEFMSDLSSLGIDKHHVEINSPAFDTLLAQLNPQMVLFDRFTTEEQFGWRVAEVCPDAVRVLDTEDLHCLRKARQLAVSGNNSFSLKDLDSDLSKRELASIYRCDLSLIISDYEMSLLREHFGVPASLLHYVPFMIEPLTEADRDEWPTFDERADFITIGNFLHEPNWDAVLFLKQEIWPLIRAQLPDATLHVSGAYPSHKVYALHDQASGFLIKGRAASVNEVMVRARVCLAPLRFGAGIKGKLVDAMQAGTPNVTTAIGAEGMHGSLPWCGLIGTTAKQLAAAAVKLYTDSDLWHECQAHGANIINRFFAAGLHEPALVERLAGLQAHLAAHRQANFTGAMLMHHSNQSTRFKSLYIEAKNRLRVD